MNTESLYSFFIVMNMNKDTTVLIVMNMNTDTTVFIVITYNELSQLSLNRVQK